MDARIAGLDRKWWVLLSVGVGTFMSALDGSIVNTVLPVIERTFGVGVALIEWVLTVYLVVISGLLLSFGRLGDLKGHKRVYVWGFAVFVAGSALCGAAPSAGWLIAFRGLQGVGSATLLSTSPAILVEAFPDAQRGRALGLQAMLTYLGLTIGPVLGGWLTHAFTWRAVFYVNVPIGLAAFLLALRFIPHTPGRRRGQRFDWAGATLFLVGMVTLLLALNQGHAWGWRSAVTLGALALAVVLLTAFVRVELGRPAPMLDLSLFRIRIFAGSAAAAVLNYICLFAMLFLLPFYLIQARGLNAAQAGLLLTAQPLMMAISAPISGARSDRIGTRAPAVVGMVVLGLGLWMLSLQGAQSGLGWLELSLAVVGLGTGVFISPNNSALLGAAPLDRKGIASGVLATARNVGMVLGVALAGAIYASISLAQPGPAGVVAALHLGMWITAGLAGLAAAISAIR